MLVMSDQIPLTEVRPLAAGLPTLEDAAQSRPFHSEHLLATLGTRAADLLCTIQAKDMLTWDLQPDGKVIVIKGLE